MVAIPPMCPRICSFAASFKDTPSHRGFWCLVSVVGFWVIGLHCGFCGVLLWISRGIFFRKQADKNQGTNPQKNKKKHTQLIKISFQAESTQGNFCREDLCFFVYGLNITRFGKPFQRCGKRLESLFWSWCRKRYETRTRLEQYRERSIHAEKIWRT